jgi:N-formylglutamate deformylase
VDTLKALGHTVSVNHPYYGGELTRRHCDPANGINSVFIEINKRMFIDTRTFKKTEGFQGVKASIESFLAKIVEHARSARR